MRFWDSSAVVALLVEQGATAAVSGLIRDDPDIVTWWATAVECSSAIARLEREAILPAEGAQMARDRLGRLMETWDEVQPTAMVRQSAIRLLRLHPLRAADALQAGAAIVFAEHDPSSAEVVCLDDRLAVALRREGFVVHCPA